MSASQRSLRTTRPRFLAIVFVTLMLGLLPVVGAAQSLRGAQEAHSHELASSELCVAYDEHDRAVIDPACVAAVDSAAEEASAWPSLDPSGLGDQVLRIELARAAAAEEASAWPSLDPSALGDQVLRIELARAAAAEEAAGWPSLDTFNPASAQHTQEIASGNP